MRISRLHVLTLPLVLAGCGIDQLVDPFDPPPVPDDYPQLGDYDNAAAKLRVGTTELETDGYFSYDDSGVEERMRSSASFDHLDLDFQGVEEGEYRIQSGELEADWRETSHYIADADCGSGMLTIVGSDTHDRAIYDDVIWGTIQLSLCDASGSGKLEVSGRFSAAY